MIVSAVRFQIELGTSRVRFQAFFPVDLFCQISIWTIVSLQGCRVWPVSCVTSNRLPVIPCIPRNKWSLRKVYVHLISRIYKTFLPPSHPQCHKVHIHAIPLYMMPTCLKVCNRLLSQGLCSLDRPPRRNSITALNFVLLNLHQDIIDCWVPMGISFLAMPTLSLPASISLLLQVCQCGPLSKISESDCFYFCHSDHRGCPTKKYFWRKPGYWFCFSDMIS